VQVGYVQSRWVFTNPQESYLTKAQEVSLNYHMRCEQYTHSATGSFFNFNGTAGVWRRACIDSAGGWLSRTTVEDMDLSLRAYLKGWRAIFLQDVTCLNEVTPAEGVCGAAPRLLRSRLRSRLRAAARAAAFPPPWSRALLAVLAAPSRPPARHPSPLQLPASFFAFRKQQHRWTCGPVQLWYRAARDIWRSPLPPPRKLELVLLYFGVRKVATHFVALGFFCTLVPLAAFTPEVAIPTWVLVHLPVVVTVSTAGFTPRGWVYSILYVLFENAMGLVKLWAVVTGARAAASPALPPALKLKP
jgi:beta-mannan synthase